jgi:uncharacterized protein YbjT (DUF2867 family)
VAENKAHIVTGAYGYSGSYIARRLLEAGYEVRTITNSPQRANPFGERVAAFPFHFDRPELLAENLTGASVLYNTYWVRFNHRGFGFQDAIANSKTLFDAARRAGVSRIVHVSITNPSPDSDLPYFSGKAKVERALIETGIPYAILRPTVLFGREDILINNIAWALKTFPVFPVPGAGQYRLQPIYVDDLAKLAVEQGQTTANAIIDATGPETFTYRQLVQEIGTAIGQSRPTIPLPPQLVYIGGWLIGKAMGDVFITWDEIKGLTSGLLHTDSPPAGDTRLTDWVRQHGGELGGSYSSELARRRDRLAAYDDL